MAGLIVLLIGAVVILALWLVFKINRRKKIQTGQGFLANELPFWFFSIGMLTTATGVVLMFLELLN